MASETLLVGERYLAVVVRGGRALFVIAPAAVELFDGVVLEAVGDRRTEWRDVFLRHVFQPVVGEFAPQAQVPDDLPVGAQPVRQAQAVAAREIVQVVGFVKRVDLAGEHVRADVGPGEVLVERDVAGRQRRQIVPVAVLDTEDRQQLGVGREVAVGRILRVGESHLQIAGQLQLAGVVDQFRAAAVVVAQRPDHHAVREIAAEVDLVAQRAVRTRSADVRSAFEHQRVDVLERGAQRLCEPVGVHAVSRLHPEHRQQVASLGVYAAAGGRTLREEVHLFVVLHQFLRIHQVVRRKVGGFDAGVERVGDLDAALLGHLGRDDDHAVCGARAVDRRSRSVLEDGDGFDAVDVEVVNLLDVHLKSVEDEDRQRGVGLERVLRDVGHAVGSADLDAVGDVVGVRSEFAGDVRDHERRIVHLQRLQHVGRVDIHQVGALHLRRRTRETVFGFGNKTRDHERLGLDDVGFHADFERPVADGQRLGLHADHREGDLRFIGRYAERECSVCGRRGSALPVLDRDDRYADHRLSSLVPDHARYRAHRDGPGHYRGPLRRCGLGVLRQHDGAVDEPIGEAQFGEDAFEHLVHGHLPCRNVHFARDVDVVVAVKYFVSGQLLDFGQQGRERFFP